MIKALFAGMFIFNGIPHLIKGITGETHMTPFKRVSSPMLNVFWAFANIILGLVIYGVSFANIEVWAFVFGGFLLAVTAALLFGKENARLPWHKD